MSTALVIGSGPAAAGASLALSRADDVKITVLDIGLGLEDELSGQLERLASARPDEWDPSLVTALSQPPVHLTEGGLPQKRLYGSDYPFRNIGQLDGITAKDANSSLVSAAYGGFSTVWGSQLMPFSPTAFSEWPISAASFRPHYEAILREIPFAAEEDDLAADFPLMVESKPLPPLSQRTERVLEAYSRHRSRLNRRGVRVGKARLAFHPDECVRCGLCMTGCPYGLIYSAAQTFDALDRANRITRLSGFLATELSEDANRATVWAKDLSTGETQRFDADRIFVACGAVGTTRLVANSLGLFNITIPMLESQQFVVPLASLRATEDPRLDKDFTLNQFNMTVTANSDPVDMSQLHFYTFNAAFSDALPRRLRGRTESQVLRRLTVALGYLPSWRSPRLSLRVRSPQGGAHLPPLHVSHGPAPSGRGQMLRTVLRKLVGSGPLLDLYPLLPGVRLAAPGKSYHWGGSFPHKHAPNLLASDRLGRVGGWRRTHLVDASVFPSIPAMTFTLTIMANAHRVASESLHLPLHEL
jgi:ferredoxin